MNDLMRLALSVAAAALVGLLVWLGVFNKPGQDDFDLSAYGIERGAFVMLENGQVVGQEEFVFSTNEVQVNLNSTVTLTNGETFTPQYRLSDNWQPVRYLRNSHDPARRDTVLVEVQAGQVRMNRFADGQARESTLSGTPPLILLDDNVVSHFVILLRLLQSQPDRAATALLPDALESAPLTVEDSVQATLLSGSQLVSAQRHAVRVGEQTVYLYSQDGQLIAVSHPNQGRFAYRSDLFADGLQER